VKQRTVILSDLVEAANYLDKLQDVLTHAYVVLRERHGDEAEAALRTVTAARDAVFDESLAALLEQALTSVARLP
jgi:hypothetical protein